MKNPLSKLITALREWSAAGDKRCRHASEVELETCPCCGFKTLVERDRYDICPVCFWEDDATETNEYWREIPCGPNSVSLRQAQLNFIEFGACDSRAVKSVRSLCSHEIKDPSFTLLPEVDLTGMEPFEDMSDARTVMINDEPVLVGEWKWRKA